MKEDVKQRVGNRITNLCTVVAYDVRRVSTATKTKQVSSIILLDVIVPSASRSLRHPGALDRPIVRGLPFGKEGEAVGISIVPSARYCLAL